ncbi:MAG: SGNH/GDSL hydrolase family protein [Lentisphaeria bacterium]|nr:SGNH/GDSL hydrolase family protein [Lentisphaeria bacterium]
MDRFAKVLLRLQESKQLRTVLFGASNTDRYMPGIHWGDVLHLGLRYKYGKPLWVINSGSNGNNTREALARFDRDVKSFSPDIVIVTLGGNDCDPRPEKFVPLQEYRNNLREIADRIHSVNGIAVFQTYYRMDIAAMEAERASGFLRNMDIIREEAENNNWPLVDQMKLFDQLDEDEFRYKYMLNPMHVNENGNILIGLELLRHLDCNMDKVPHQERLLPVIKRHWELVSAME